MKYMRRYLNYLEKYLDYEKDRFKRSEKPDAEWRAWHACCCKVKDVMKKKFDEIHQAFKPVESKTRFLTRAMSLRCDDDWPSCAPEKRFLPIMKKK
ncbi:MAG TPA: hypothetical protein VGB72_08715 [Acidobacteriota bacterium]